MPGGGGLGWQSLFLRKSLGNYSPGAYEVMRAERCKPDAIVYNAIIDALWETGVIWAQHKALSLFCTAVEEGHFRQVPWAEGPPSPRGPHSPPGAGHHAILPPKASAAICPEVNLHAMTAGVAMLSLYTWLLALQQRVLSAPDRAAALQGRGLPPRLAIVTDKGKSSKEQGNLVVKEAVAAMMAAWGAPFRPVNDGLSSTLEAAGGEAAAWLAAPGFELRAFAHFPCRDAAGLGLARGSSGSTPTSPLARGSSCPNGPLPGLPMSPVPPGRSSAPPGGEAGSPWGDDAEFGREAAVDARCTEAFAAVAHFERTHCLALQNMGPGYLARRPQLVALVLGYGAALGLKDEVAHDAVLLLDRTMSTPLQLKPELQELLAPACLVLASRLGERGAAAALEDGRLTAATGLQAELVGQMVWTVRGVLGNDTAAISTLRCLKLYLERLGATFLESPAVAQVAGSVFALARETLSDVAFLNCRPSVIAAAVLYAERRHRGVIPFWPSMLAALTGYQDMSTAELSVAIKAAQRLVIRHSAAQHSAGGGGPPKPLPSPRPSSAELSGAPSGGLASPQGTRISRALSMGATMGLGGALSPPSAGIPSGIPPEGSLGPPRMSSFTTPPSSPHVAAPMSPMSPPFPPLTPVKQSDQLMSSLRAAMSPSPRHHLSPQQQQQQHHVTTSP